MITFDIRITTDSVEHATQIIHALRPPAPRQHVVAQAQRILQTIHAGGTAGVSSNSLAHALKVPPKGLGGTMTWLRRYLKHTGRNPNALFYTKRTSQGRRWFATDQMLTGDYK